MTKEAEQIAAWRAFITAHTALNERIEHESAELLYRERMAADRRGAFAVLTDKGLAELRKTWPVYAQGIMKHFAQHLSDNEVHLLAEVFQRLLANIHEEES